MSKTQQRQKNSSSITSTGKSLWGNDKSNDGWQSKTVPSSSSLKKKRREDDPINVEDLSSEEEDEGDDVGDAAVARDMDDEEEVNELRNHLGIQNLDEVDEESGEERFVEDAREHNLKVRERKSKREELARRKRERKERREMKRLELQEKGLDDEQIDEEMSEESYESDSDPDSDFESDDDASESGGGGKGEGSEDYDSEEDEDSLVPEDENDLEITMVAQWEEKKTKYAKDLRKKKRQHNAWVKKLGLEDKENLEEVEDSEEEMDQEEELMASAKGHGATVAENRKIYEYMHQMKREGKVTNLGAKLADMYGDQYTFFVRRMLLPALAKFPMIPLPCMQTNMLYRFYISYNTMEFLRSMSYIQSQRAALQDAKGYVLFRPPTFQKVMRRFSKLDPELEKGALYNRYALKRHGIRELDIILDSKPREIGKRILLSLKEDFQIDYLKLVKGTLRIVNSEQEFHCTFFPAPNEARFVPIVHCNSSTATMMQIKRFTASVLKSIINTISNDPNTGEVSVPAAIENPDYIPDDEAEEAGEDLSQKKAEDEDGTASTSSKPFVRSEEKTFLIRSVSQSASGITTTTATATSSSSKKDQERDDDDDDDEEDKETTEPSTDAVAVDVIDKKTEEKVQEILGATSTAPTDMHVENKSGVNLGIDTLQSTVFMERVKDRKANKAYEKQHGHPPSSPITKVNGTSLSMKALIDSKKKGGEFDNHFVGVPDVVTKRLPYIKDAATKRGKTIASDNGNSKAWQDLFDSEAISKILKTTIPPSSENGNNNKKGPSTTTSHPLVKDPSFYKHMWRVKLHTRWIIVCFAIFCWENLESIQSTVSSPALEKPGVLTTYNAILAHSQRISKLFHDWLEHCCNEELRNIICTALFGFSDSFANCKSFVRHFDNIYKTDFTPVDETIKSARSQNALSVVSLDIHNFNALTDFAPPFASGDDEKDNALPAVVVNSAYGTKYYSPSDAEAAKEKREKEEEEEREEEEQEENTNKKQKHKKKKKKNKGEEMFVLVFTLVDGQKMQFSLPKQSAYIAYRYWAFYLDSELQVFPIITQLTDFVNTWKTTQKERQQEAKQKGKEEIPKVENEEEEKEEEDKSSGSSASSAATAKSSTSSYLEPLCALNVIQESESIFEGAGKKNSIHQRLVANTIVNLFMDDSNWHIKHSTLKFIHYWLSSYVITTFIQYPLLKAYEKTRKALKIAQRNKNINNNNQKEEEQQPTKKLKQ